MRFIKLELVGGLGNQLFEYAMARSLMEENDHLLYDISNYKHDFYDRHFTLNKYKVKGKTLNKSILERFFNPYSKTNRIVKKFGLFTQIIEKGFYVHDNVKSQMRTFTSMQGYWQSYKYFQQIKSQLQSELIPLSMSELPGIFKQEETVVVHLRRTDFLNDPRFGVIDKKYYNVAINTIKSTVQDPFFIFFSDDISWCKQNFIEEKSMFCDFPEWKADYHRLYLMSQCKHHIISNSSFSWWGAWLCANPGQVVIRPRKPFKDPALLYEHYYPEEWIAAENE